MTRLTRSLLLGLLAFGPVAIAQDGRVRTADQNDAFQSVTTFQFGESRKNLAEIEAEIRAAKPGQYRDLERSLLRLLTAKDTRPDAKRYLARYLSIVGSDDSVPALAALLSDEKLSHPARIALEAIPDPDAAEALREALPSLKGEQLAGLIGSIGARRDDKAVSALVKLTTNTDANVANAAIAALGRIASSDALKALEKAQAGATDANLRTILRARVAAAHELAESGRKKQALEIFKSLQADPKVPTAQRVAAARGAILLSDRKDAVAQITQLLGGSDQELRNAALAAFRASDDAKLRAAVVEQLPSLNDAARLALLPILSDFPGLPAHQPILTILHGGGGENVKVAALGALAVHGEASDLPLLLKTATSAPSSAEKDAARRAIENLGKPGVDEALTRLAASGDPAQRGIVISALAKRSAKSALPTLVKILSGSDAAAASEAAAAIGAMGALDQLASLISTLEKTGENSLRSAAERAAGELTTRLTDSTAAAAVILPALERNTGKDVRVSLLRLLPRVKGDQALAAAKTATGDSDTAVREAAVRALSDWPDAAAAPILFEVADKADNEKLSILAMQGAIRLGGLREVSNGDRVKIYRQVIESAKRVDEKKRAVAGLGDIAANESIELLTKLSGDEALLSDVTSAALRLGRQRQGPRERINTLLETIAAKPGVSDEQKKQIAEVLKEGGPRRRR